LRVLGLNEASLDGPAAAVHARYGPTVEIEPPQVRYQFGPVIEEPVLSVVVRGPRRFALRVRDDLVRRGAEVVTVTFNPTGFIARANVTQAELLGYPAWLDALMGGPREAAGLAQSLRATRSESGSRSRMSEAALDRR
jgi:hypothetical protein